MQTRINPRSGDNLPALGFGWMRLPRTGGRIDMEKAEALFTAAVEGGVTYFDTAYIYPGSERALGTLMRRTGLRDKVQIATKMPLVLTRGPGDFNKFFSKQLERLQVDTVEYYMLHMLGDLGTWERLVSWGIREWIAEKKAAGAIQNIGFSFHGGQGQFLKLLDAYDWDFAMIQYNYLDEHNQAGRAGLEAAAAKGLPVIVMEPLRGGRLASGKPEGATATLALRWVFDHPAVTCVLSGMENMEQLTENIAIASDALPGCLTDEERAAVSEVIRAVNHTTAVPCTVCRYCLPCPAGVDIPECFTVRNVRASGEKIQAWQQYMQNLGVMSRTPAYASKCTGCGICEPKCPQAIPIRAALRETAKVMEPWWIKPIMGAIRWWLK